MTGSISNPSLKKNLFSAQGRISRATYIAWIFVASFISGVISLLILSIFLSPLDPSSVDPNNIEEFYAYMIKAQVISLPITLISLYFYIIFTIKRLHDLNLSGWLSLLSCVPFINFFFALYLIFAKGNISNNKFGEPRVALSWETTLAWIYIIIMCFVVLIMVSALTQLARLF